MIPPQVPLETQKELQELQQSVQYMEVIKSQVESLAAQADLMEKTLEDYARAHSTLESLKDLPEGSEMLVPIGADSFMFTKVSDNAQAIVGCGANVSIQKPIPDALGSLEGRIKEIEDIRSNLNQNIQGLQNQAMALDQRISQLYQKHRSIIEGGAPDDQGQGGGRLIQAP